VQVKIRRKRNKFYKKRKKYLKKHQMQPKIMNSKMAGLKDLSNESYLTQLVAIEH